MNPLSLGIIGSTRGTVMQALIESIEQKNLNAKISIVISNKKDAFILERAQKANLPFEFIDSKNLTREQYDKKLSDLLKFYSVNLVVLIGYMRILSPFFVNEWRHKIINIHPSLLPNFAGMKDIDIHKTALDLNLKETGCTIHQVIEEVDAGAILHQKKCAILKDDSVEKLKSRVQLLEGQALIEVIQGMT